MRIVAKALVVAFMAITGIAGFSSPASAATVTVSNVSYSQSSASQTATAVARVDTMTKVEGEFIATSGFRPSNASTLRCPKVSDSRKVPNPASYQCVLLKKGQAFRNSLRNRSRGVFYFSDVCGSRITPAIATGTNAGYCMFYYDKTYKVWRKPSCGNYVQFAGYAKPPVSYTNVVQYKSFTNVKYHVTVKLYTAGTVYAYAQATCTNSASGASSSAQASTYIFVDVYVYVRYSVYAASSGVHAAITSTNTSSLVNKVTAKGVESIKATASAWCQDSPPPPPSYNAPSVAAQAQACVAPSGTNGVITGTVSNPNNIADFAVIAIGSQTITVSVPANGSTGFSLSGFAPGSYTGSATLQSAGKSTSFQVTVQQCTPPQQTPPSIVNYTTLNDVDAGGTSPNFCATVNIPGSDQGTLTFAATYGSFTTTTFTVAGLVQKCTTYVAPTEVPSGGRDSITVYVRDNTTGLSAQSPTQSFPINTPPAPPV